MINKVIIDSLTFKYKGQMSDHNTVLIFNSDSIYTQINSFFSKYYQPNYIKQLIINREEFNIYCYEDSSSYYIKVTNRKASNNDYINLSSFFILKKYKPQRYLHKKNNYMYDFSKYNYAINYSVNDEVIINTYFKLHENINKLDEIKLILKLFYKNNNNHKIPIVLGITGYRDIHKNYYASLETKVSELFDNLIEKYPETPFVLLTPLADGADRIITNVVFKDKYKEKITVSVALPMDEENYKDTFAKGITAHKEATDDEKKQLENDSKKEYDDIINKVNLQNDDYTPKIIPMLFEKELYEQASDDEKRKIRRKQYSIVGEYIAIHSNILIAMYNFEDDEKKEGSTREIVDKKLNGNYEYFSIDKEDVTYPECGIVYAISTPLKGVEKSSSSFEYKWLPENNKHINTKVSIISKIKNILLKPCISLTLKNSLKIDSITNLQINCFNKDVENKLEKIKEKAKDDISNLNGIEKIINENKLNISTDKLIHKNMMIRRSAAHLSSLYQAKMKGIEKVIIMLIAITIFTLLFKSNFPSFNYIIYTDIVYLVLIVLFFIIYYIFKGHKEKYEDYRALSESLRIQTAWNMANINSSTALYYLSRYKSELEWIRVSLRGINIFYIPKSEEEIFSEEVINKYWIDEQISHFEKKINKLKKQEIKISKKIKFNFTLFLVSSAIFSILNFTSYITQYTTSILNFTIVDLMKLIFMIIPFIIATSSKSKQHFDGNIEILREYKLSLDIFKRAKILISDKDKNSQKIYLNLGIEALRENSSWLITKRTKDYDIPV